MRSSWLASATNCRTRVSLCWRAVRAEETCPSMRLRAAPTWPTSVRGSASGTRSWRAGSPLCRGSSETRVAVAATRRRGRRATPTRTCPAREAAIRPARVTQTSTAIRVRTVRSVSRSGSPRAMLPSGAVSTRKSPSPGRSSSTGSVTPLAAASCAAPASAAACASFRGWPRSYEAPSPGVLRALPRTLPSESRRIPAAPSGVPGAQRKLTPPSRDAFPGRIAMSTEVRSCLSTWSTRCERRARVVTVPMAAPTTAISTTAETTSRVRSDQGRRRRLSRMATTPQA